MARVTRPILDRDRPVRSWASEVSPIPTREGADTVHAGPEESLGDQDPIFRGVVGGGRVVDEWIRQAQQTARLLGGTGSTFGWADTSGRMVKAASDLMAAWLSLFGAIPPNGEASFAAPRHSARPESTWAASDPAPPIGDEQELPHAPTHGHPDRAAHSSSGSRVRLEIASRRPVEVTLDLHRNGIAQFRVLDLRAESGDAPRIQGTTLEGGHAEGLRLRLTVPDDQPRGTYHAVILDSVLDSAVGTVTLRVRD